MKICGKCKEQKPEGDYFFKNKVTGKRHSYCKSCKRDVDKKAYKNSKVRQKAIRDRHTAAIKNARAFVENFKKDRSCTKCGDNRWYVLDFHHLRDKDKGISKLVQGGASIERIKKEIQKCELLCANCHREEHFLKEKKLTG